MVALYLKGRARFAVLDDAVLLLQPTRGVVLQDKVLLPLRSLRPVRFNYEDDDRESERGIIGVNGELSSLIVTHIINADIPNNMRRLGHFSIILGHGICTKTNAIWNWQSLSGLSEVMFLLSMWTFQENGLSTVIVDKLM